MILGIGTDIIDIRRIEKTILKYGDKFKNKCFLKSEIQKSENRINSTPSYAKIYAAKAFSSSNSGSFTAILSAYQAVIDHNDSGHADYKGNTRPAIINASFGPTIPTPMTRLEPSSKRTLVTPSFRPNERLRPLAAQGNFPFP